MEALTTWQLLRLETLLEVAVDPRHANRGNGHDSNAFACVIPPKSIAKGFIDKSYDQLCEAVSAIGWDVVACRTPDDGVAVSLIDTAEGSTVPLDRLQKMLETVREQLSHDVTVVEKTAKFVAEAAGRWWATAVGLTPSSPSSGMGLGPMASLMGGGMDTQMLRMSLTMGAAADQSGVSKQPSLSQRDVELKNALNALSVDVVVEHVTSGDDLATVSAAALSDQVLNTVGRVIVRRSADSPKAGDLSVYAGVCSTLDLVSQFLSREHATPDGMEPRGKQVNTFLLLAAIISAERRRQSASAGSMLRFPLQLLEMVLWRAETQFSHRFPSWFDTAHQQALQTFMNIRERVEYADEVTEQRDDETDEEYLDRVRPKSYLDFAAQSLPMKMQR